MVASSIIRTVRSGLLQDAVLTLTANPNNIVDVYGSTKTNTLVQLCVPTLTAAIDRQQSEFDAAQSSVVFNITADSARTEDSEVAHSSTAAPDDMCRATLSLPKHHPKSLLHSLVRQSVQFMPSC